MPEEAETEYKYASKDDRKINQTYIIAKKNEGEIEALTSSIQDLTNYIKVVEGDSEIELEPIAESDGAIWRLEATGFSELTLYPGMSYPSETNYPGKMTSYIIVTQNEDGTKTNETYIDLGFPLIAGDKLVIENNKVYVERGNSIIDTGQNAILKTFDPKTLISIKYFDNAHLKCQYIEKNEFTKYFATQAQMQSQIQITDEGISSKVSKAELISEINQSAEKISMTSNRIEIDSEYFKLTEDGKITSTGGTIGGYNIGDRQLYAEVFAPADFTQTDINKLYDYIKGRGSLTDEEKELYDLNHDGELDIGDVALMYNYVTAGVTTKNTKKIIMQTSTGYLHGNAYIIEDGFGNVKVMIGLRQSIFNEPLLLRIDNKDVELNNLVQYKTEASPNENPISVWIDGKYIYRKVIQTGAISSNDVSVPHNIDRLGTVINIRGMAKASNGNYYTLPRTATGNVTSQIELYATSTNVVVHAGSNANFTDSFVIIEYTKEDII